MKQSKQRYEIENVEEIDSPSIVLYKDRFLQNIEKMISMVDGNTDRLMPHIKTNKISQVIEAMVSRGIRRIKASTISEAELAAISGVKQVLIAHQLVGPKIDRFMELSKHYKAADFATIIDNKISADILNRKSFENGLVTKVYIDFNNGMNRTGIKKGKLFGQLINYIFRCGSLQFMGLHVYDGHIRDVDFNLRKIRIEKGFEEVDILFNGLKNQYPNIEMICGGTPSFTTHLLKKERVCSPGTFVFWDKGYDEKLSEQEFDYAALVICRVISKPTSGIITVDLGHKSIASENPIDKRVRFLNMGVCELISQSEEHGVVKVEKWDDITVGDVIYGIPYHICPTINLYDEVSVIDKGIKSDVWKIAARSRKIGF